MAGPDGHKAVPRSMSQTQQAEEARLSSGRSRRHRSHRLAERVERIKELRRVTYLDTHVVAWLYSGDAKKISKVAWAEIQNGDPAISPMVILELELLFEIGRAKTPASKVVEVLSKDVGLSVCGLPFALQKSPARVGARCGAKLRPGRV